MTPDTHGRVPLIGVHVSIAGGLSLAVERAVEAGCTTFQIFSRSPRMWASRGLDPEETARFRDRRQAAALGPLAVHAPYLINLASLDQGLYRRSIEALSEEITRGGVIGADAVVVHVGTCLEGRRVEGVRRVVEAVRQVLAATQGPDLLLENTAGERGDLGAEMDELGEILDRIGRHPRLGVCLDTCHAFAAGYDLSRPGGVSAFLQTVEGTVGMKRVRMFHVNDSKKGLACHVDRHEHIGKGHIGLDGFRALLTHPAVRHLPCILETPKDTPDADQRNISLLRRLWAGN